MCLIIGMVIGNIYLSIIFKGNTDSFFSLVSIHGFRVMGILFDQTQQKSESSCEYLTPIYPGTFNP